MQSGDVTSKYSRQTVLEVRRWASPGLCSVRTTRPDGFNFVPGQFARIGLPEDKQSGEPSLWRAYSMVTHPEDPDLEFFSVTVSDGQFSPLLAALEPGDSLWIENNPFGFLTLDRFQDGQVLWLISTGTGLSAYIPMLRDSQTWDRFETVVLVHGVRTQQELAYRDEILQIASKINTPARSRLIYLCATSREPWPAVEGRPGPVAQAKRITAALLDGTLTTAAGVGLEPKGGRVMLCGNPEMVTEMRKLLAERGFAAGRRGNPGNLAVENYW
ncbi:ferredoxin--NADP reductase [Orrella marina]|uniref:ferredoxin--NADP(+) reductase n=1 Tax=Orrella marina TaxID=2163011 RepID=A0A2R4XJ09_9BURK|nr:ferredoxin--NADP reductase [Orrella marina]AWB33806.1 ferredoxin--NADP(+) reductase [Orrella marina]